jgi:hypothetical protein
MQNFSSREVKTKQELHDVFGIDVADCPPYWADLVLAALLRTKKGKKDSPFDLRRTDEEGRAPIPSFLHMRLFPWLERLTSENPARVARAMTDLTAAVGPLDYTAPPPYGGWNEGDEKLSAAPKCALECWLAVVGYDGRSDWFRKNMEAARLLARLIAYPISSAILRPSQARAEAAAQAKAEAYELQHARNYVHACFFGSAGNARYRLAWKWEAISRAANEATHEEETEPEVSRDEEASAIIAKFCEDGAFKDFLVANLKAAWGLAGLSKTFGVAILEGLPVIGPVAQAATAAGSAVTVVRTHLRASASEERAKTQQTSEEIKLARLRGKPGRTPAQVKAQKLKLTAGKLLVRCVEELGDGVRNDALKELGVSVTAAALALVPWVPASVSASGKLAYQVYGFLAQLHAEYRAVTEWRALCAATRGVDATFAQFEEHDWMKLCVARAALGARTRGVSDAEALQEQGVEALVGEIASWNEIADDLHAACGHASELREGLEQEGGLVQDVMVVALNRKEPPEARRSRLLKWLDEVGSPSYFAIRPLEPRPPSAPARQRPGT